MSDHKAHTTECLAAQARIHPEHVEPFQCDCPPAEKKRSSHIVNEEFQSDKYPDCPAGKVPLSTKDPMAQDLLWQYAQRRRTVDAEFSDDLERALLAKGYTPLRPTHIMLSNPDGGSQVFQRHIEPRGVLAAHAPRCSSRRGEECDCEVYR
ncbi:MAG TPA: hypothetical protein VIM56_06330 [Rhizomicrobium sp.]